jgi:hypothetical protein
MGSWPACLIRSYRPRGLTLYHFLIAMRTLPFGKDYFFCLLFSCNLHIHLACYS